MIKSFTQKVIYFLPLLQISTIGNAAKAQSTDGSKPNIIFILTDDHRADALSYAGHKILQTPVMDQLAHEGTYFKNAVVTTPICAASRASILTGLYERTHGYTFQSGPCKEDFMQNSYPYELQKVGYYTGFYGKLGVNYKNANQLFNVFEDYDRLDSFNDRRGYFNKTLGDDTVHLSRYTGQKGMEFIENVPKGKPFFLSLCFSAPHAHDGAKEQYFWSKEYDNFYKDAKIPDPLMGDDKYFKALPENVQAGFSRLRWTWRFDTPEKYQEMVKGYFRMISEVDAEIGKIRKKLAEKGLEKNTIFILMGDNGYFLGERQIADKWLMYDLSIKVPLIVFDPRANKHQDIETMALNIDVPATIIDFAGGKQPSSWHGKSLVPIVNGSVLTLNRDTVLIEHLWEFNPIPPSEGVRTNNWKYLRYVNDKSVEELYDLQKDKNEAVNLVNDKKYAKTLSEFRIKCDELVVKYKDPTAGVPSGLMVEYIRDPKNVEVIDSMPEYCWIVPQQAVLQKGYQILVSSTRSNCDKNIGDVWDSKQVRGNNSIVEHSGKPLKQNTTYFWKVRIWDADNRLTNYSKIQEFKTGIYGKKIATANSFMLERIQPVSINKTRNNSYFIDFGKAAFGNLEFEYKTDKNDTLVVRLGEKLLKGAIDRAPGGTIRYKEVKVAVSPKKTTYLVQLTPDSRNTKYFAIKVPDTFGVVLPFRYCEIDNYLDNLSKDKITQKAYFNYFDYNQSKFTSNDTILNQVWEMCKYTMKATTTFGLYVDGDRERIPYEGDAYINQLGHYTTDREYSMAKRTIEHFIDHPTWPTEWLLHTVMLVYQDYMYTSDKELIAIYYNKLRTRTLINLTRDDGLISVTSPKCDSLFVSQFKFSDPKSTLRDIVDWPKEGSFKSDDKTSVSPGERDMYEMVPINTVVNSFFYMNMLIMSEFADILGKPEDKAEYLYLASKVSKSINEKLFNKSKGIYIDGEGSTHSALHANMFPLAFGIVPKEHKKTVANFVKSRGMKCSVYGAQFLLDGLYNVNESNYALELMTATHDRSWYNMIAIGSTMALEAWDYKYKPNLDWNHAWGAAPANTIPRQMWGITPKTAGFSIISIKPQLGTLTQSEIETPTIRGNVKATYKKISKNLQKFEIEIPANTVAEFSVPLGIEDVVIVNGKTANPAFSIIRLEPGKSSIEIRINTF